MFLPVFSVETGKGTFKETLICSLRCLEMCSHLSLPAMLAWVLRPQRLALGPESSDSTDLVSKHRSRLKRHNNWPIVPESAMLFLAIASCNLAVIESVPRCSLTTCGTLIQQLQLGALLSGFQGHFTQGSHCPPN